MRISSSPRGSAVSSVIDSSLKIYPEAATKFEVAPNPLRVSELFDRGPNRASTPS